jgi:hypothetical protein
MEGTKTGQALCFPGAHHACCQRGTRQHKGLALAGPPLSSRLPLRAEQRNLCFLCCTIKLSFAFKVPRPVIIQAILAKFLGPCSFELLGQLWRNPTFPVVWLTAGWQLPARLLPSGLQHCWSRRAESVLCPQGGLMEPCHSLVPSGNNRDER